MSEPLERGEVIALLNELGGERDEDVLEAARRVHARVTDAGLSWEDLLIPDEPDYEADDDNPDEDDGPDDADIDDADTDDVDTDDADTDDAELNDPAPVEAATPAEKTEKEQEALRLIDALLAKPNCSKAFIEELNGYKADIAEGHFDEADHRYIRALSKRLSAKP